MSLEVKILPFLGYNQIQANTFWLNHTQAIIMNYIVASIPFWAESKDIDWETYFRAHSSKFLSDMPTLDISRNTLTKHVTELVEKGLIKRKIVNRTIPYFKATEKWLYAAPNDESGLAQKWGKYLHKNCGQYKAIINQIKKEKNNREEIEKLIKELSSYLEWKKKHENVFELDNIKWWKLVQQIKKWLLEIKEWTSWIKLIEKKVINQDYINSLVEKIVEKTKLYDKYDMDVNWNPTPKLVAELTSEIDSLFSWYSTEEKTIKNLTSTIWGWIGRYFKRLSK